MDIGHICAEWGINVLGGVREGECGGCESSLGVWRLGLCERIWGCMSYEGVSGSVRGRYV